MKFAQVMELRLQRIVLLSFASATLVLLIYGFITVRQTQEKATNFIFSHISQMAKAEISAQSVSDIDRKVGQLFSAWTQTQDFRIRIDVFLNEKLVGHAGDLQRLGPLSVVKTKKFALPSGQELELQVELDITAHILFVSAVLLALMTFLAATFFMIRKHMQESVKTISRPLEEKVKFVTEMARNLPASLRDVNVRSKSTIQEITELDCALKILFDEILILENRLVRTNLDKGRLEMAEEVAHNLKGALSVLQLRVNNLASIDEADRDSLRSAIRDLTRMSLNFIKRPSSVKPEDTEVLAFPMTNFKILAAVQSTVRAKAEQYKHLVDVRIYDDYSISTEFAVSGSEGEFKSVISNLIDNAVEALNAKGHVQVAMAHKGSRLEISVKDNGHGIPADVLPKLMTYRGTFGKADGNGLGLFHAKKVVATMGGKISIESQLAVGTSVEIHLPMSKTNDFPLDIELMPNQTVVIIDDEECVHSAWKLKFQSLEGNFSLRHFRNPENFEQWIGVDGLGEPGSRVYFSDFDLRHKEIDGLDLIAKHQIQFESFLVTGLSNDAAVIARAQHLGLRVIGKDQLHLVELKVRQIESSVDRVI